MSTRFVQVCFIWYNSGVKAFLCNTIGCPILAYGMEFINLSESNIKQQRTMQGNTRKIVIGISKHSHHSNMLKALGIPTVDDVIKKMPRDFTETSLEQTPLQETCNLPS